MARDIAPYEPLFFAIKVQSNSYVMRDHNQLFSGNIGIDSSLEDGHSSSHVQRFATVIRIRTACPSISVISIMTVADIVSALAGDTFGMYVAEGTIVQTRSHSRTDMSIAVIASIAFTGESSASACGLGAMGVH